MKKIAIITLLAAAGLVQVAHGNEPEDADTAVSETTAASTEQPEARRRTIRSVGVPSTSCPDGTYPTGAGHCNPSYEFD
ncbi:hypothetical protein [Pseudomonas oryzicola]|uniref:Uncharacterized protein n=1 Tax=Pseudomonas oryzicola TaxID=485876 RepID=A0ABS6QC91_9PSED|nr:hypothetical protein [Pseudomonas oryzicola]MBV4491741.1 hypothetical protein [Pseudomonas oryzicola]